jgi:hydroxymethylpyrimidine pyrophosphatase-like HAD family hydrolase
VINYNGAVIWDGRDDKPQFHEPLSPDVAQALVRDVRAAQSNVSISVEVLDRWHAERVDSLLSPANDPAAQPDVIGPIDNVLRTPVTKINIVGTAEQIQAVMTIVREQYWKPRRISVFLTDPRLIQVMHPLVDKGIALQRLARRMSVQREQVMAIGGGQADAGMVEWAGFGVAVENALPVVKQLAKAIVPGNNDQGVARALQRFVLVRR